MEDGYFGQVPGTCGGSVHVEDHLHGGCELAVEGRAVQAAQRCQCFQAGWDFGWRIGVEGARAAVVAGVEGPHNLDAHTSRLCW